MPVSDIIDLPAILTARTSGFNRCPSHLATSTSTLANVNGPMSGRKAVSYDVAAWADLWFYSNPIYVQVNGSTAVAGVN